MREAFAANNHDFVLSQPASKLKNLPTKLLAASKRVSQVTRRGGRRYLSILAIFFFTATAAAILLNALVWQRTRHPAPLFSRAARAASTRQPKIAELIAVPLPRPQAAVAPNEGQGKPVEKPAAQKSTVEKPPLEINSGAHPRQTPISSSPAHNQTSQSLTAPPEPPARPATKVARSVAPSKLVLAAQRALVKLGFVLNPDGVAGPTTRQAIERYERDHGLPVSGELTPALTRRLTAEAGISKK